MALDVSISWHDLPEKLGYAGWLFQPTSLVELFFASLRQVPLELYGRVWALLGAHSLAACQPVNGGDWPWKSATP